MSYALDTEAAVLGTQIIKALKDAGVDVSPRLAKSLPFGVLGIHVSGWEPDLVVGLRTILVTEGQLVVAQPEIEKQAAYPDQPPATITVAEKPVVQ